MRPLPELGGDESRLTEPRTPYKARCAQYLVRSTWDLIPGAHISLFVRLSVPGTTYLVFRSQCRSDTGLPSLLPRFGAAYGALRTMYDETYNEAARCFDVVLRTRWVETATTPLEAR